MVRSRARGALYAGGSVGEAFGKIDLPALIAPSPHSLLFRGPWLGTLGRDLHLEEMEAASALHLGPEGDLEGSSSQLLQECAGALGLLIPARFRHADDLTGHRGFPAVSRSCGEHQLVLTRGELDETVEGSIRKDPQRARWLVRNALGLAVHTASVTSPR